MYLLMLACLTSPAEHRALQVLAGDADGDGYADARFEYGEDCDDGDPEVNPGVVEVPYNGKDDDCNPQTLDDDFDADSYPVIEDCDDFDSTLNPQSVEIWYDGIDQNCDGNDSDADLDGEDWVGVGGDDCDDGDPLVQMLIWYTDADGDGFGDLRDGLAQCEVPADRISNGEDCDDADAQTNPMMPEICDDGKDNDCSGDSPECGPEDGSALAEVAEALFEGREAADRYGAKISMGDLSGDGVVELAIAAPGSGCVYVEGDTQREICPGALKLITVVDIDGDGSSELLYSGDGGALHVLSGQDASRGLLTEVLAQELFDPVGGYWTGLWALDSEQGRGEVLSFEYRADAKDYVNGYAWNGDGFDRDWVAFVGKERTEEPESSVVDLDGDGLDEVIVTLSRVDSDRQIFVFSPQSGAYLGSESATVVRAPLESVRSVAGADVDGDGYGDLILGQPGEGEGSQGVVRILLGPTLVSDVEEADGTLRGEPSQQLGEVVCAVTFSVDAPALLFASVQSEDGGVVAFEGPTEGGVDLHPMWRVEGEPLSASGSTLGCGTLEGPSLLVASQVESTTQPGQVYLLGLHSF